jgi:UDP-glucuronate 4-epimerase
MNFLVTGAAGFIGFHLSIALLESGNNVVGVDNLNDYYDPILKKHRLKKINSHANSSNFKFFRDDISIKDFTVSLFSEYEFDVVINLAAQAGVRYSLQNPHAYIDSNISGFLNILEGCRNHKVNHLIYASSSSVYGMNIKQPFSTNDRVDYPISLYAATKKSNELMAHSYSHLYNIPTTGLRFFTVYGPYGRPDMAYYKFTKSILNNSKIDVFNNGNMKRDFTYIDDIVDGILKIIQLPPAPKSNPYSTSSSPYQLFNIGNNNPISLREFIGAIELACGVKANQNLLPMQPGDVPITYAEIDDLQSLSGFKPKTSIKEGIKEFVEWYKQYISLQS